MIIILFRRYQPMPEKETYTMAEAARILSISKATMHRHAESGKIPTIRLVGRVVIPRAYIDGLFAAAGFPREVVASVAG